MRKQSRRRPPASRWPTSKEVGRKFRELIHDDGSAAKEDASWQKDAAPFHGMLPSPNASFRIRPSRSAQGRDREYGNPGPMLSAVTVYPGVRADALSPLPPGCGTFYSGRDARARSLKRATAGTVHGAATIIFGFGTVVDVPYWRHERQRRSPNGFWWTIVIVFWKCHWDPEIWGTLFLKGI
ncbi:hypothetical protein KM043_010980 [Ampulex compressa]|nr:hypothetical protein KM043_010980 [Ampulex compressa]